MDDGLMQVATVEGGDDAATITDRCNEISIATGRMGLVNPLDLYAQLLSFLRTNPHVSVVPLGNILDTPAQGKISVALRHDIDADIVTAISCARALANAALPGSFYLLHTAHYYGAVSAVGANGGELTRHSGLKYFLEQLKETGVEIGLHNDALGLAIDHGIDGCQVLRDEIDWLRQQGVEIKSTVAHNSAAIYEAECFEVFRGLAVGGREFFKKNGRIISLQRLDQQELGLEYEANFPRPRPTLDGERLKSLAVKGEGNPLHSPSWLRQYFIDHPIFTREYDYDVWLVGKDLWLLAGRGALRYPLTFDQLAMEMGSLSAGSRVVVSIHPIYVSQR